MKEVTKLKRKIFPVGISVFFILAVKLYFNPELDMAGAFILVLLGIVAGMAVNAVVFKESPEAKNEDNAEKNEVIQQL